MISLETSSSNTMILDTINNANFYKKLSKNIDAAIDFLQNNELKKIESGRHEVVGDEVYALVFDYETHPEIEDKWEAHRKYFDIQFIVEGTENIAIADISDMSPITDYIEKDDYQLFKGKGGSLLLKENDFIILGPRDVHQPGIQLGDTTNRIRKIVIKAMI